MRLDRESSDRAFWQQGVRCSAAGVVARKTEFVMQNGLNERPGEGPTPDAAGASSPVLMNPTPTQYYTYTWVYQR